MISIKSIQLRNNKKRWQKILHRIVANTYALDLAGKRLRVHCRRPAEASLRALVAASDTVEGPTSLEPASTAAVIAGLCERVAELLMDNCNLGPGRIEFLTARVAS